VRGGLAAARVSGGSDALRETRCMHDGFGTINDGYFLPHSHELRCCGGHWLLLPAGAKNLDEALASAPMTTGTPVA
jgi:hypothetical protein